MDHFRFIFSHLMLLTFLLTQVFTPGYALEPPGDAIVIAVVVILIIFVGMLGIFIAIVLCKITNLFGIFNKQQQQQSRFSSVLPPPTLRPSSYLMPHVPPEEAPPTYDDVRGGETGLNPSSNPSLPE